MLGKPKDASRSVLCSKLCGLHKQILLRNRTRDAFRPPASLYHDQKGWDNPFSFKTARDKRGTISEPVNPHTAAVTHESFGSCNLANAAWAACPKV